MTTALLIAAIALVLVAFGVQLYYLRGLQKAGVEVSSATKVVSYINMSLLALVALGLTAFMILNAGR
ncbi:MAG TPA: hypothetical protein VLA05_08610 [Coriobacteriia bacterium]|nr:hypothetical protein [Coriobacteriia bacterium]